MGGADGEKGWNDMASQWGGGGDWADQYMPGNKKDDDEEDENLTTGGSGGVGFGGGDYAGDWAN